MEMFEMNTQTIKVPRYCVCGSNLSDIQQIIVIHSVHTSIFLSCLDALVLLIWQLSVAKYQAIMNSKVYHILTILKFDRLSCAFLLASEAALHIHIRENLSDKF